ncbi:hypothetical protein [Aquamicrobium soli]|uniref:Uncharacterized protein n=1 Tax=Aquamicrobium soli TaxID=1811518 RepID=A0ABV7KEB4_9HYPH
MTELEITERLILAVEIERAAGNVNVGPGRGPGYIKAMSLGYVHDWADKNGWGRERLKADEQEYQDSVFRRPTPAMVSEAEEALTWYALVRNEDHRAALAAWVDCMAGHRFFKDWCAQAGISEKTGRKRKNAAVASIHAHLVRCDVQNCDIWSAEGLLEPGEIGHVDDRIGDAWRGEPYFLTARSGEDDFNWAAARNKRRRQRRDRQLQAA